MIFDKNEDEGKEHYLCPVRCCSTDGCRIVRPTLNSKIVKVFQSECIMVNGNTGTEG